MTSRELLSAGADLVAAIRPRIPAGAAAAFARIRLDPATEIVPGVNLPWESLHPVDAGFFEGGVRALPAVHDSFESLGPGLADRLWGVCESALMGRIVPSFAELRPPDRPDGMRTFGAMNGRGDQLMSALNITRQLHPGIDLRARQLAAALVGVMPPPSGVDDGAPGEAGLAAAHGGFHLAVGLAAAALVAESFRLPSSAAVVDPMTAVCALAVDSAIATLNAAEAPDGYRDALLAKARKTYLMPRRSVGWSPSDDGIVRFLEPGIDVDGPAPRFEENGLVELIPGGFAILSSADGRIVPVSLQIAEERPDDPARGTEIVELSWRADLGAARASGLSDSTPPWPGEYRLRVVASGRDRGDPRIDLCLWRAAWQPTDIIKVSDQLGALRRGEIVSATPPPPVPYAWIRDTPLRDAGTVTVVAAATVADVAAAFGALQRISTDQVLEECGQPASVVLLQLGSAVVAVESNGWKGSAPRVVASASSGTRAASVYWSVNRCETLSLAEDGSFLAQEEFLGPDDDMNPVITSLIPDADPDDPEAYPLFAFVAMERFTGVTLTADAIERAFTEGVAWRVNDAENVDFVT